MTALTDVQDRNSIFTRCGLQLPRQTYCRLRQGGNDETVQKIGSRRAGCCTGINDGRLRRRQNELLKVTIDKLTDIGETVTQSKKADEMAAALLAAADTAAAQEANNGKDAEDLLLDPAVIKAAGIDPEKTPCVVNLIDDVQFKSSGMMGEFLKIEWMGQVTSLENFDGDGIGTFNPSDDDKVEIGAATHKIGDESYILILLTYTTSTT